MKFIILIIYTLFCSKAFGGIDVKTYIPKKAPLYISKVSSEQTRLFPETPRREYIGALIEQESCISLTHSKCWDPTSTLNTTRELGVGWFQITKAYKKDGGIRFDTLRDLRKKYPEELSDLSWENITTRVDLQIRAGILLLRDNYKGLYMVPDPIERLSMADSAYNGGYGNVIKARKICGLARNCNPNIWFGNVELHLPQSRAAIYGKRSAVDINVEHVHMTMKVRVNKYKPYFN